MPCFTQVEEEYLAAKARLQAAQQEKLEAAVEFVAARATLRRELETLWPEREEQPMGKKPMEKKPEEKPSEEMTRKHIFGNSPQVCGLRLGLIVTALTLSTLSFGTPQQAAAAQSVGSGAAPASGRQTSQHPQTPVLSHDIHAYVQPGLLDFTVTLKTGRYNKKAGEQISKEFGQLYKIAGNGTLHYKQPNRIRLDGKIVGLNGVLIMDGFTQHIRIGFIHKNQDESQAPGKVTTLLDTGLLNEFYLSYTNAQFQGVQAVEGTPCAVFRLSYAARMHDTSFRLVWIDPNTRILRRREEHGQDGALHAVYTFRNPVLTAGVWLPSEVDAANAQGEFVGQTFFQDAHPNTGLTDHLFR